MKRCFINGISAISAQNTFESDNLDQVSVNETEQVLFAQEPNYKDLIPPTAIRRMAKVIKMGIATTDQAMKDANVDQVDAIIAGTGMGCSQDSEKFLKNILNNQEQFLTPTPFIQSTHNTVAAQIAIRLGCRGYNLTYAHSAVSFESALLDACMQICSGESGTILTGGIDENAPHYYSLLKMIGHIKSEEDKPYSVLNPSSGGAVFGEGATFFVLESTQKDTSYGEITDIHVHNRISKEKIRSFISEFLQKNKVLPEDIDLLVLGNNGDEEFDGYYSEAAGFIARAVQVFYKHLTGEYNTSSAFGLWLASGILQKQRIPDIVRLNNVEREQYRTVLLYNQYRGLDHSLILLRALH